MIERFLKKIFGSRNDRLVKQYGRTVRKVNDLEPQMQSLDDATLQAKTSEFRQRVAGGEALDGLDDAFCGYDPIVVLGLVVDLKRSGQGCTGDIGHPDFGYAIRDCGELPFHPVLAIDCECHGAAVGNDRRKLFCVLACSPYSRR